MAKRKYSSIVASVCLLLSTACSSSPTAPATTLPKPAPVVREVSYDINIPSLTLAATLTRTYPNGVRMAPLSAQRQWDFTAAYGGSPNVYYGETAPAPCQYLWTGIVVAPLRVSAMDTFTAQDWPGLWEPGFTYAWVGRFTYSAVGVAAPAGSGAPCVPKQ